jgi:transcription elongation GreA/GreB family factor
VTELRRLEWQAEHRFLIREKQRIERRIEELADIIRRFAK